ncbi:S24 family peptidase [Novosphingobium panipatense]|uniref:Peptidase S24-like n=1 Tax=Novosphingobium panipatense TaxID=428991 RepID=A0ABY1Q9S8_9SPHN|nr:S24 family peptidase [Novosphingobium panipatense]SMP60476.1 Peptidase S24-like [Novosphingobium panipatense]
MAKLDPRRALDELIKERGESYSSVSRLLSRNPAYIQQFIKRGSPTRLDDSDIAQLSVHFGVPGAIFGGDEVPESAGLSTIAIPVLSATDAEDTLGRVRLVDEAWLRSLSHKPTGVSIVMVEGDAMYPTLRNGDEVLIQRYLANENPRDGLYVIRADAGLLVRRIALEPTRNRIAVLTDNPTYPNWDGLLRNGVQIVGRVIWAGLHVA